MTFPAPADRAECNSTARVKFQEMANNARQNDQTNVHRKDVNSLPSDQAENSSPCLRRGTILHKNSVVDLARDPTTFVDDGNSGEFHYESECQ